MAILGLMTRLIETERLYFRELEETDAAGIFELDSDPEVHQFLGQHPIKNITEAQKTIEMITAQYKRNGIGRWAIIEKASNEFVGWGGFKLITEETNRHINYHDLGYRFIKRFWGKGYATESAKASVDYAFNQLNLPVIYAIADVGNAASQKVLEKCGLLYKETFDYEAVPHRWYEMKNPALGL